MGDVINLRRARKSQARDAGEREAERNRAAFGRTKAERQRDSAERTHAGRKLDQHRLDEDPHAEPQR